jgi:hypothetical protein
MFDKVKMLLGNGHASECDIENKTDVSDVGSCQILKDGYEVK